MWANLVRFRKLRIINCGMRANLVRFRKLKTIRLRNLTKFVIKLFLKNQRHTPQ
jgi:hypothetical protein